MSARGKWGLGLGALVERVSGWSWCSWLRAPNPILACLPKASVLRGAWWVLRPTHPGVTSSKLGKALTWGVSWRGYCLQTAVPRFSATGSDPINPWPLLFLAKLDVSVSGPSPSLVLGRMPSEDRPHPFSALGWESGLQDSLPTDS